MVGRGGGGTCAEEPGVPVSLAAPLPSPLLLPPTAQSHRMVWEHCSRLWSLPEHTSGILDLSWEELYPMQGVCWAPRMPKQQPGVMAACGERRAGTAVLEESPCRAVGKAAVEHPGLLCQGQSLGDSGAGC